MIVQDKSSQIGLMPGLMPRLIQVFTGSAQRYEPSCEKTGNRGFRPGPTQTGLYCFRRWLLLARGFKFRIYRKMRDCTIYMYEAKTNPLISLAASWSPRS